MKFAEKYEILEMVTSGRVSTFLARERTTKESVVVYTFECVGTGIGELNTASIIARFATLAPSPPGVIVKAGFDEASSSAFITTKTPDSAALKEWVRGYHAFGKPAAPSPVTKPVSSPPSDETAELSAAELRAFLGEKAPAEKRPSQEEIASGTGAFSIGGPATNAPEAGGEFTRLFREVNAFQPLRPAGAAPKPSDTTDPNFGQRLGGLRLGGEEPTPAAAAPPADSPGAFTREFLGIGGNEVEASRGPKADTAPSQKEPGAFTKEFLSASSGNQPSSVADSSATRSSSGAPSMFGSIFESDLSKPTPAPRVPQGEAESPRGGTGEFTRFFSDPFENPGASERAQVFPNVASSTPPAQKAGDFTRVFGALGAEPEESASLRSLDSGQEPAPGSFTQIFGEKSPGGAQLGSSGLDTNPNLRPSFSEPASTTPAPEPRRDVPATPVMPPTDPFFSRTPAPVAPPANPTFVNRGLSSTTEVFKPGGEAPAIDDVPSGPSEFTVFLNRNQLKAILPPEAGMPSGSPAGVGQGPTFAPPPIPNPFVAPPIPKPPAIAMPAIPAPPPVPKPAAASIGKPGSLWPLITVLTILLAVGALLVMYFMLKH